MNTKTTGRPLFDNPVPRRANPLILDRADYDELVGRLTSELRPPNALAEQTVRLLAQELLKLHFSQRVEFALIDRAQHVDDGALRRMREGRDMRAKGKSVAQCEKELAVLGHVQQALGSGQRPQLKTADLPWLTAMLWGHMSRGEEEAARQRKLIEEIDQEASEADEEDQQHLAECRQDAVAELQEAREDEKTTGRRVHGVETARDLAAVLSGATPLPEGTKTVWIDTLSTKIAIVAEQRNRVRGYDMHIETLRLQATHVAAQILPQLEPIQRHSATIWKNIERCLKQLALLGVDLKSSASLPGTQEARI